MMRFIAPVALLLFVAPAAGACTMMGPTIVYRGPKHGFFLGTATADTVRAGPGAVTWVVGPGQRGQKPEISIFGQVVRIDAAGGSIPAGTRRAVLVPWSYDTMCNTSPWIGSAKWLEPGKQGLYDASLRDSKHWAGGMPTFDIFLTYGIPYQGLSNGKPDGMLSPDRLFDLLQRASRGRDPRGSLREVVRWMRANPEPAKLYPADQVLSYARWLVNKARLEAMEQPVAGTYHTTVTFTGAAPRIFTFRTRREIDVAEDSDTVSMARHPELADSVELPRRYLFELRADTISSPPQPRRFGEFSDPPELAVWFPLQGRDSAAVRIFEASLLPGTLWQLVGEIKGVDDDPREETPVTFRVDGNGEVSFDYRRVLSDGRILTITGSRTSRNTIP